jgi:tetratricopeptide (TPR) repeat protein
MKTNFSIRTLCLFAVGLILSGGVGAQTTDRNEATVNANALLGDAISSYGQGQSQSTRDERLAHFDRARRLFAEVAKRGINNVELLTNVGTAALQAEQFGPAVLNFRRALALDPGHSQAGQNLLQARALLPAWVPRPEQRAGWESLFFWREHVSTAHLVNAATALFFLCACCIGSGFLMNARVARTLGYGGLAVWAIVASFAISKTLSPPSRDAVLVASDTFARASDSDNAPTRFPKALPAGTEVTIITSRDAWTHVALADTREAWVPSSALEIVTGKLNED